MKGKHVPCSFLSSFPFLLFFIWIKLFFELLLSSSNYHVCHWPVKADQLIHRRVKLLSLIDISSVSFLLLSPPGNLCNLVDDHDIWRKKYPVCSPEIIVRLKLNSTLKKVWEGNFHSFVINFRSRCLILAKKNNRSWAERDLKTFQVYWKVSFLTWPFKPKYKKCHTETGHCISRSCHYGFEVNMGKTYRHCLLHI